jgi:ubiquinone/menaquinone biosynthesis C-methylase UbiE
LSHPEIRLDENDGQKLNYTDKSFDVSFTYGCMIHVSNKKIEPFFKEICRVTRGKGLFIEASEKGNFPLKHLIMPPVVWYSHDYEALFRRFNKPYEIITEWEDRDIIERLYLVDFS